MKNGEPLLSIVIPVRDGEHFLARTLGALQRSSFRDFEVIVADDGSRDGSGRVAEVLGAKVVSSGGRLGAAAARNAGVRSALGRILVFVDADVAVHENALAQIVGHFEDDPSLSALMGAYDDAPEVQSILSRFRNLLHAYVHRHGNANATTFWTGLGAVRRVDFDKMDGFNPDETLEDVEFGVRLHAAGRRIVLDPAIQGTHLKRWTLMSMLKTDLLARGVPWIELALRRGELRNDLNTTWTQRISVAATGLLIAAVVAASVAHGLAFIGPAFALIVALMLPAWRDTDAKPTGMRSVAAGLFAATGAIALLWWAGARYPAGVLGIVAFVAALRATIWRHASSDFLEIAFALLVGIACVFVLAAFPLSALTFFAVLAWALELVLNRRFLAFLVRRMGLADAIACAPLLLIYHANCVVAVGLGIGLYMGRRRVAEPVSPGT